MICFQNKSTAFKFGRNSGRPFKVMRARQEITQANLYGHQNVYVNEYYYVVYTDTNEKAC